MKPLRALLGWALAAAVCLSLAAAILPAQAAFRDVAPGSWYEGAVTQLTQAGALTGYPDGTFRPDQPISAAEFVVIAVRLAGLPDAQGQTTHWAAGKMQAALQAGWYDWDEIPPTGERFNLPISRQLAVKILMRALLPDARGDYVTESAKIKDFNSLDGRYYESVLAAYASGVVHGDPSGAFNPLGSLTRAEACTLFRNTGVGQATVQPPASSQPLPEPAQTRQGGVSQNGWLQVVGTQLCGETGEPVVLRGMSSHGLQWYGQFASAGAVSSLADCGANLFRAAMYTGEGGYLSQPEAMRAKLVAAVDAAIENDLYVIIDWHILSDGDPMAHVEEAEAFFSEMAQRYRDTPNVLYEICNEPNGNVSWGGSVKPYAQRVIGAIRARSPRAVILVGSPTWSQDIHLAAADPLEGENLMYTLHFYAGTHGAQLRQRIDDALAKGLPVFVSEWGTSRADGSGGVFLEESKAWLDFLDARGISWCNWSLCDKGETSAALRPGTSPEGPWGQEQLTESGKFVFSRFSQ
ncbi:MAG: cellulase family glycosylhydrolase [Clostridiales bacterium]|nr:cellulase family glycosylhydrolase [Clostridiales bacterium]